jgi:hypothetical protein
MVWTVQSGLPASARGGGEVAGGGVYLDGERGLRPIGRAKKNGVFHRLLLVVGRPREGRRNSATGWQPHGLSQMTGIGSCLEVEQHHQHIDRPAVAGKRQQQPVNVVGCASREVRERLKRVQRPAVLGNTVRGQQDWP